MAPPPTALDFSSDFAPAFTSGSPMATQTSKTLLLCPPAVAANPEVLQAALATHPRSSTDVQMLDRIAMGLVNLPAETYATVILLSDPTTTSPSLEIDTTVLQKVTASMTAGGKWVAEKSDVLKQINRLQVVLAGLVVNEADGPVSFSKPNYGKTAAVPLKFGKKAKEPVAETVTLNGKRKSLDISSDSPIAAVDTAKAKPVTKEYKVGFVDFSDDFDAGFDDDDDDDLIDENTLLDDGDLAMPVQQPAECQPKPGKRRRACKDCTCGLKEKIEAEDSAKRKAADAALKATAAVKLDQDDLAEIDFTVEGKASSCGNCYLGDAFRCDGCPYIGLPAFKPGEQVQIPLGDDQL